VIKTHIKLTFFTGKHRVEIAKIIVLRCQPNIGHTLVLDNDIVIELINDVATKTHIQINDCFADYDMNIVVCAYYRDIENDELIDTIIYYLDSGWKLICDACGLLEKQEGETK
jgi:hypothetical protein